METTFRVCGRASLRGANVSVHIEAPKGAQAIRRNSNLICIPPTVGDAGRFGTVVKQASGWTVVVPFDEKMRKRAYVQGALDYVDPEG